ncbi:MAG TPA: hypothetical protein VGQ93_00040 [Lysobacter sp.]|jgi:hypothetical protein|nr:hypothetical protein [Lysobacter sp.]
MPLINADGRDVTAETLIAVEKVIRGTGVGMSGSSDDLRKASGTITLANNLVAYDLEAPSKNLYPVMTPLRNRIPRSTRGSGAGDAVHWKEVSAINGGTALPFMGWVPEGRRAPRMGITTADRSAAYVTFGLESDVTFEAQSAGMGFEDVLSTSGMRLLQQTMIIEENAILGGNKDVLLGTTATPTLSASGAGGTLPTLTYSVRVFALSHEGYMMTDIASGIKRLVAVASMDGQANYNLCGGSSAAGAAATQAVTLGQTLFASIPALRGAVAYAWYVGAAGAERLERISTINSIAISVPLLGTGQLLSAVTNPTTDYSANDGSTNGSNAPAFNGLLYAAYKSGSLAQFQSLATGTAGTGTPLTASSRGSVNEIDVFLKNFWDTYRLSPDEIYVNAQELLSITNKTLNTSAAAPMIRFNLDVNQQNPVFVAGQIVAWYFNPYTLNGGQIIPIRLHPNLAPGTILFWCQNLPAQYESANVPLVAQVQCRRDYYQIPWPIITRSNATGVYSEEVLKIYFPPALGVLTNIGNG